MDPTAIFAATMHAYVAFARQEPERFRLMFRCDVLDMANPELSAASKDTFARLTNVIRSQRGEAPLSPAELAALPAMPDLAADVLVGWCQVHGLAHLLIEGQLAVMHDAEDADGGCSIAAFLDAVVAANAPRLAAMLQDQPAGRTLEGSGAAIPS